MVVHGGEASAHGVDRQVSSTGIAPPAGLLRQLLRIAAPADPPLHADAAGIPAGLSGRPAGRLLAPAPAPPPPPARGAGGPRGPERPPGRQPASPRPAQGGALPAGTSRQPAGRRAGRGGPTVPPTTPGLAAARTPARARHRSPGRSCRGR